MTKGDWIKAGIFTGAILTVGFSDESIQQKALKWRNNSGAVRETGKFISRFGGSYEAYILASLGAYGILFKNKKIQRTTLLATGAYITGSVMVTVIKALSGRRRPDHYGPNEEAEPRFLGPFGTGGERRSSSFPSGHTTVAFAVATVFSKQYSNRPFVGIIAYSAASLIGFSRITENKHWMTDVMVGAALGYLTGKQVVNNYHHLGRLKPPHKVNAVVL